MGKAPAFQFYPMDWSRDLEEHPLEIEGAWIRICCKLWWEETRGTATKSLENWARILREKPKKTLEIFHYLVKQNIADGVIQNGTITITSRRMIHDENIRKIRKEAGSKGGNPILINKANPKAFAYPNVGNQNPTPSSSSSLVSKDTSSNPKKKPPKNPPDPRVKVFLNWYSALYERKFKTPYVVSWPKDSALIKPLVASVPWLDLQYAAVWFVRVQDEFIAGTEEKLGAGYGVGIFTKRINECLRHINDEFRKHFEWITVNEKGESNERMD